MKIFTLLLAALAVLMLGMQMWIRFRARRMLGATVGDLPGPLGRAVATGRRVLIYIHSPACAACRQMTPIVRELAQEREGVFLVDAAADPRTAMTLGVMATPSTVLVQDGRVVDLVLGPRRKEWLQARLEKGNSTS